MNWRAWLHSRNAKIAAGAAAVGVAGLAFVRSRRSPSGAAAADDAAAAGPNYRGAATYDSTASDVYNSLLPQLEMLRDAQAAIQDQLDAAAGTPTAPAPPGPAPKLRTARIGKVGTSYGLRAVAARFAGTTNPNGIEAYLRRLVTQNPYLRGRTTVPGGLLLTLPPTGPPVARASALPPTTAAARRAAPVMR